MAMKTESADQTKIQKHRCRNKIPETDCKINVGTLYKESTVTKILGCKSKWIRHAGRMHRLPY
jgi:hypothetical protein